MIGIRDSNQESAISNQQSAIRNQQSAISNQQSAISNQESGIGDQTRVFSQRPSTYARDTAVAGAGPHA
jgi:hypothetical protein